MFYQNRQFAALRRRMRDQLLALGWTEYPCIYPPNARIDMHAARLSPQVLDIDFHYEEALKRINTGQASMQTETTAYQLGSLTRWSDTLEASCAASEMIESGIPFTWWDPEEDKEHKGHITVMDWDHPEKNTFAFVQGWRGAMNDRFGWDFVLMVNAIPVGAILLQHDEPSAGPSAPFLPCQTAYDLAHYQMDHDRQFPVYCRSLIVGNGKQLRIGTLWDELEDMDPISSLDEELRTEDYLIDRILYQGKMD